MKKYMAYLMMLIKSTWKIFGGVFLIALCWLYVSFFFSLKGEETFESVIEHTGGIYLICLFAILFLMHWYRRNTERQKRGLLLPIAGREILICRVAYSLGWAFILTTATIITLYIQGRIYIAAMPEELVSPQTVVMSFLSSDFGSFLYGNPIAAYLLHILLFASFASLVSLDSTILKGVSGGKITLIYAGHILVIFAAFTVYVKLLKIIFISGIPIFDLLFILFLLNGDVFSERLFGQRDR